ncbi:MAG TPA: topoisomerase C-terminal repeat-containing protein [Candidatus Coprovivens excrementavium]|nr:topoisomerase C-terminal repeat-containing protein [Candidatus Coprovivens excrementavium]
MILIIAEKPSLARNIVGAIGNMKRNDGFYSNQEYLVSWAFGHLFTLADIEDYEDKPTDNKWKMDNLPCFPKKFKFNLKKDSNKQIDSGIEKQFKIISNLVNREDVIKIVNAGDSDREGEIIVRLCIENSLKTEKEIYRLWLPDQTSETINQALREMKLDKEYDNLANEGFARTYIDWLYGVNLTRYATLKTGTLLRVGRVIIPIVKAIYDRDMAIRNFKPEMYYGMWSNEETNGEIVELNSKEKFDKNNQKKALELCEKYNSVDAIVVDKKVKKDIMNPPKLFSLTKLQNLLGKKYKIPMNKSLEIVQKLYESGYLTYPRTNSEYLAVNEKDKVKKIIEIISKIGYPVKFKDKKTIFDDSKIESHSAITPTYKIPKKENLSEEEFLIYQIVFKRFVAVFCSEDCKVEKTEIKISVGNYEDFLLKGMIIKEVGWTKFDTPSSKDKILPNLNVGDKVNTLFKLKEKETTPPKHYTIETLNNYLMNPFKEDKKELEERIENGEEVDDTEDYKAIFEGLELGTEATRTGIIDNAKKSEYIQLKKDVYTILPKGEYLIESLSKMNISMDKYKTSEMGKALKKVYRDEISVQDSVNLACQEIKEVFEKKDVAIERDTDIGFYGDIVGKCPLCGNDVIRNRFAYGCRDYQNCKFKINTTICGRIISKSNVEKLLNEGVTSNIEGFISKNGKNFNARLKLDNENKVVFDFSN